MVSGGSSWRLQILDSEPRSRSLGYVPHLCTSCPRLVWIWGLGLRVQYNPFFLCDAHVWEFPKIRGTVFWGP